QIRILLKFQLLIIFFSGFSIRDGFSQMCGNVFVYGKLRVWGRGFSEGKSEAGKRATNFVPAKTSNFLYTVLCAVLSIRF
uniref:hypothetical protein n=1 Tax=Confluentibacter citreus TaxID=2007307 RepID=UPI000C28BDBC